MIPSSIPSSSPESQDFSPEWHDKITRMAAANLNFKESSAPQISSEVLEFLAQVQAQADRQLTSGGDKTEGRMYLHQLEPRRPFDLKDYKQVLGDVPRQQAIDTLLGVSKDRAVDWAAQTIQATQGQLSPLQAGAIWYVLGTFLHAEQDYKHREGNIFHSKGTTYSWVAHFTSELHQTFTDVIPPKGMKQRAIKRTEDFTMQMFQDIKTRVGNATIFESARIALANFKPSSAATNYRPDAALMDFLFPSYAY